MLRLIYRKKGITLIELLITLALIGIVITLIFTLQLFSVRTFSKGDDQSNIQYRTRMAADFMTKELRNAYKIEILSSMPATIDTQKRYFYIKDNKIKHYFAGIENDVLVGSLPNLVLTIAFNKSTTVANQKVLNYTINAAYKEQNFNMTSAVFPMNTKNSTDITGLTDGAVVAYSSPLTPLETVAVDKILLELKDYNLVLQGAYGGSLTLNPPTPNVLMLIPVGKNGSTITWLSDKVDIVTNDGAVTRPGVGVPDKTVTLTATLSKVGFPVTDTATVQKDFTVIIKALVALVLNTGYTGSPLTEAITIGSAYQHEFTATEGTGVYTFSMTPTAEGDDLSTHGLTFNANGTLEGKITEPVGSYTYTITVQDDFVNDGTVNVGLPSPNKCLQTVTLVIIN